MKEINSFQIVKIPEECELTVDKRVVTVKGQRGTLTRNFRHLAICITKLEDNTIKVCDCFLSAL